jgi:hypothetical protein
MKTWQTRTPSWRPWNERAAPDQNQPVHVRRTQAPNLQPGSSECSARLKELAKPLEFPVVSRPMTGGEFGTIVDGKVSPTLT